MIDSVIKLCYSKFTVLDVLQFFLKETNLNVWPTVPSVQERVHDRGAGSHSGAIREPHGYGVPGHQRRHRGLSAPDRRDRLHAKDAW